MQVLKLLHELSRDALSDVHFYRRCSVWSSVGGLLLGRRCWLTHIGRSLDGVTTEKHSIKRVDRLLGNRRLGAERLQWYQWISQLLVSGCAHPVVLVDWSNLDQRQELYVLRAALAVGGRAIPLYEEVECHYASVKAERRFLKRLKAVLPPGCRPILVSDAGFRTPWLDSVASMGWYYVGRIRHRHLVRPVNEPRWASNKLLYRHASTRPKSLGNYWITKSRPLETHLTIYKGKKCGRVYYTAYGKPARARHTEKPSAAAREPWLLASNLPNELASAHRVVAVYRRRMQIEESFRDMKSARYGFALRENMGRNPQRLANLLLLCALATLAQWLVGLVGQETGLLKGLQANTEKRKPVLSVVFVGARLIAKQLSIRRSDLLQALQALRARARRQLEVA
jgi:hypothetical protein